MPSFFCVLYAFLLLFVQIDNEGEFASTGLQSLNPEGAVAGLVGSLDGFFPVFHGLHLLVVDLQKDDALGGPGLHHLTATDGIDGEAVVDAEAFHLLLADGFQADAELVEIDFRHDLRGALGVAQGDGGGLRLLVAEVGYLHLIARLVLGYLFLQFRHLGYFLIVNLRNHVALLQFGLLGCAAVGDLGDIDALDGSEFGFLALGFLGIDVLVHVLPLHAEDGSLHGAIDLEVGDDLVHDGGGDGEAVACVAARLAVYHGVDAYEFALLIDECSSGVSGIDGGVGLYEALDSVGSEGTGLGGDDAGGDGGGEVEGVADGEHPLSESEVVGVANLDGRKALGVNLHEGEVGGLVGADDASLELAAVVELDGYLVGLPDDVVVGHDVAVLADDDSAAGSVAVWLLVLALLGLLATLAKAEEVAEEVLKGILNLHFLGLALDGHGDIDNTVDGRLGGGCQIDVRTGGGDGMCRGLLGGGHRLALVHYCSCHHAAAQYEGNGSHPILCFLIHNR